MWRYVRIRAGRGEISGEPQDEHHDEAFRRRCRKRYRDMVIWFPSAEDLVLLKLNLELDGTPILMMFRDR